MRCEVNALEVAWFDSAARDSELSEELAAALADRPAPDFRRLKVGLGCMLAALLVLALPMMKPAPGKIAPAPLAAQHAPAAPMVRPIEAAKKAVQRAVAKKPAKRAPAKVVARK